MAKVRLDLDRAAINQLSAQVSDDVSGSVSQTLATRVRRNIVSAGRVDTGRMLSEVNVRKTGTGTREVSVDTDYAMFQEEGIGPVTPKRAKVLRFTVGGRVVYTKRTRGFEGAHFMRNALASLGQSDVHT